MKNVFLSAAMTLALIHSTHAVSNQDHCPDYETFRKTAKMYEEDIRQQRNFTFTATNVAGTQQDFWEATNISFPNPTPLSFDQIIALNLSYNTDKRDHNWCMAQFYDGGSNYLAMLLTKVQKPPKRAKGT